MNDGRTASILLMDDEIHSPIIQAAIQYLRNRGFAVDTACSISEALEAYYQRYYDVFILDIDMSMISGDREGDGIQILKRFVSLHNQTRVIMYSAAGKSPEWLAAANAHCFAYVHKGEKDALERLGEFVQNSLKSDTQILQIGIQKPPTSILLHAETETLRQNSINTISRIFGKEWDIRIVDTLEKACQMLQNSQSFGIVVVLRKNFKMRKDERIQIDKLLSVSPSPQVIIGCEATDEYQFAILYIANRHPFRFLNLSTIAWEDELEEALSAARIWYGRREIFPADPEALRRLKITLPEEAMNNWTEDELKEMEGYHPDMESEGGNS